MKRIVILGAMALTFTLAVPMTVQAEGNRDRYGTRRQERGGESQNRSSVRQPMKTIKFANQDGINIYMKPSTGAVVLDQAFLNTSFEGFG